jgi:hypothetical protein
MKKEPLRRAEICAIIQESYSLNRVRSHERNVAPKRNKRPVERRIARLLGILLLTDSDKKVPIARLSKHFGVSRWTIYKDIALLREFGFEMGEPALGDELE